MESKRSPDVFSVPRLVFLNVLVCGFEICANGAFAYLPPLLLEQGIPAKYVSLVLGCGPVFALFLVPKLGRWSDRRSANRRLFLLTLSVILLTALFLLVFCEIIVQATGIDPRFTLIFAVIGTLLLDFSTLAAYNPCEALISDATPPDADGYQYQRNFSIYSCMTSLGGCIGYLISSVDWPTLMNVRSDSWLSRLHVIAFSILTVIFTMTVVITFNSLGKLQSSNQITSPLVFIRHRNAAKLIELSFSSFHFLWNLIRFALKNVICIPLLPVYYIKDLLKLSSAMKRLFLVNFFSWCSIMCYIMFYTNFVGEVVYNGDPKQSRHVYEEGVRMGSFGLLLHFIAGGMYAALLQDKFIVMFGMKNSLVAGLVTFTLSMAGIVYNRHNILLINVFSALSGVGQVIVNTISLALVCVYQEDEEVR
ncbi:Uncharacterised protein g1729 [Pycnogonum litorale]